MCDFPIYTIKQTDAAYPSDLLDIYDPPKVLYVRGCIKYTKAIGVVGSRLHTAYGTSATYSITTELVASGLTIISGLAIGIDAIAHDAALKTGGHTIAVLGSGIDDKTITPRRHTHIAKKILKHGGALVSELPPGTPAAKYTFPKRNRIIAGLSVGILVTEARQKSGSLITAQYALDNNREVFAIPHPITSKTGQGTNALLQEGAHLVTKASDILDTLSIEQKISQKKNISLPTDTLSNEIIQQLASSQLHIDDLIRQNKESSTSIQQALLQLELLDIVKKESGGIYSLSR